MVLVFAVRRGWCEKELCRRVGTVLFHAEAPLLGSQGGTPCPPPCLQGVVGYTTSSPEGKIRDFSGASAVVQRAA